MSAGGGNANRRQGERRKSIDLMNALVRSLAGERVERRFLPDRRGAPTLFGFPVVLRENMPEHEIRFVSRPRGEP